MKEYSIMPNNSPLWWNYRFNKYAERHEIFEGRTGNRQKSIEDGLVIFLTPEMHRTGKHSIHLAPKEWLELKRLAQETWMNYYNKTKDDFIKRYGRSYYDKRMQILSSRKTTLCKRIL